MNNIHLVYQVVQALWKVYSSEKDEPTRKFTTFQTSHLECEVFLRFQLHFTAENYGQFVYLTHQSLHGFGRVVLVPEV